MDLAELQKRSKYHPPTDEAKELHEYNREMYLQYATFIVDSIPDSREASIAQTNLEQVMFWVNAAIARNHDKLDSERASGERVGKHER